MFGYIVPCKPELKVKDFNKYRSIYCGLCKQLGRKYGLISRFFLNYDLTMLAVLADGINGCQASFSSEGCFANPFNKKCICSSTTGIDFASDALILLSYYKLCDNIDDEKAAKRILSRFLRLILKRSYKKAASLHVELDRCISKCMNRQAELEHAGCTDIDDACEPSAQMVAAMFKACCNDEAQQNNMYRMGLFCGKVIYMLDAAEDYSSDIKNKSYNVFSLNVKNKEDAVQLAKQQCRLSCGEIAACYSLLNIKQNKDILDNIIYLGIPQQINFAGETNKRSKKDYGRI